MDGDDSDAAEVWAADIREMRAMVVLSLYWIERIKSRLDKQTLHRSMLSSVWFQKTGQAKTDLSREDFGQRRRDRRGSLGSTSNSGVPKYYL
jgi:hypothetical protein